MNSGKEISVFAGWEGIETPQFIGTLFSSYSRGKEIFSFEYDKNWLSSSFMQEIDPDLGLYSGVQYLRDGKSNFGVFLDSSPDRWGRVLMDRRESILARMEKRQRRNLNESDYLLGVFDEQRMGALRFKETPSGAFMNDNRNFTTPPMSSIRELEQASYQLENDLPGDDAVLLQWLYMLLAPGSSLGGARPKAGVRNTDGTLWIAKFPSKEDQYDVGAWEMVINELAQMAGLNVAQAMAQSFYGKHHTLLSKRFDRMGTGQRLHFASAMTLLGYTDGVSFQDGASYLELAEFIIRKGTNVNRDLEELFRRIVFFICVSNTDDHLRNHGFLLTKTGWTLSPAYDMNPNPQGAGLKLNISTHDNSLDLDVVADVASFFRLTDVRAATIIKDTIGVVSKWKQIAMKYKISRDEQDRMGAAFRFDLTPRPPLQRRGGDGELVTAVQRRGGDGEPGYFTSSKSDWMSLIVKAKEGRKNQTEAENLLWQNLRNCRLGDKFRRQHPIGEFIPDFVCLEKKLVIEVDGEYHNKKKQQDYDAQRTEYLNSHGYSVIRFTNDAVLHDTKNVIAQIQQSLHTLASSLRDASLPSPLERGRG